MDNLKQQQLLFDKGITNVPSDNICSDNALEESVGMIYDGGEHRVIQAPKLQMEVGGTGRSVEILYVHDFNIKRYIYILTMGDGRERQYWLNWGINQDGVLTSKGSLLSLDDNLSTNIKVESIGKTLIVSNKDGMHYFLLNEGTYNEIGPIRSLLVAAAHHTDSRTLRNIFTMRLSLSGGWRMQAEPSMRQPVAKARARCH